MKPVSQPATIAYTLSKHPSWTGTVNASLGPYHAVSAPPPGQTIPGRHQRLSRYAMR